MKNDPLPTLKQRAQFLSEKKPPKTANEPQRAADSAAGRPGRNLVPMKSPEKLIAQQTKGNSLKEVSDFTTEELSPSRTDGYFAKGKIAMVESPNIYRANRLIDVTQIDMNRQKNNLTSYPMTRDDRSNVSRDNISYNAQPLSGPNTLIVDRDPEVNTQHILRNLSPRDGGQSVYTESRYSFSVQKYPNKNRFLNNLHRDQ